jgi:hypothetical protein
MLSKKWSALSGSVNTALVQYQINSNGWVTASAHTTNASDIALTVTNITLNVKQTYKVSIKITDKFEETDTYQYDIPTEEVTFHLKEGGGGAAFGKYAEEEDMLDIAWKIKNNSVPTLLGGLGSTIPSNSNLNSVNFLVPGNYVCALNDTAKTLTNSPTSYAFKMCVYNCLDTFQDAYNGDWMYMVREITNLDGTSWIQFVRREGGNWNYGNWRIILDSGNCPDYVIEQGTVDGWEYTKWKNGKMELFSAKSLSFPASEKQTDYLWRSIVSLDLSKYLTKIMSGTCCIQTNGMVPQVCRHSTNLTTAEIAIVTSRTFSAFTITAPIYIIGKWK